jgi:hypothetical protein
LYGHRCEQQRKNERSSKDRDQSKRHRRGHYKVTREP